MTKDLPSPTITPGANPDERDSSFSFKDSARASSLSVAHAATVASREQVLYRWRMFAAGIFGIHATVLGMYFTLESWRNDPTLVAVIPTIAVGMLIVTLVVAGLFVKDRQHVLDEGISIEHKLSDLLGSEYTTRYFKTLSPKVGFWGFTDLHAYHLVLAIIWVVAFINATLL